MLSTAVPQVMQEEVKDPGILVFLLAMREEEEVKEKEKEKARTRNKSMQVEAQEIPEVQGKAPSRGTPLQVTPLE